MFLSRLEHAKRLIRPLALRMISSTKNRSMELDPSTLSNYHQFDVRKTSLWLKVDWDASKINGIVEYDMKSKESTESAILDTSFLHIDKVFVDNKPIESFAIAPRSEPLGSALNIPVGLSQDSEITLRINFSTTDKCTALQWFTAEQTADKGAPYMFSQCQAIHARSLFPCFDTPSVKSTFRTTIQSLHNTVTSGLTVEKGIDVADTGFFSEATPVYHFEQPIPIPSYLFAIASGGIEHASIGPRSSVYCEKSQLPACVHEFKEDTENFIVTAEKIVFPYEWQRYDVLVLPPSFPYGGMENPNMTFATPTLISGDRENVDVIAHELSHSWSGNLVTNCSWEHFWLNEGWTTYLERRIIAAVHGEAHRHLSAIIGWKDLIASIDALGDSAEQYSRLVVDLKGNKDPDDSFSTVPYEKGFAFLFYLENLLGKEIFDKFIPYYFTKFKTKSLDSYQFKDTLYEFYNKDPEKTKLDSINWDDWYYAPGLPAKPQFDTTLADACYELANRWITAAKDSSSKFDKLFSFSDISSWSTTQHLVFLDTVLEKLEDPENSKTAVTSLGEIYKFAKSTNAEVISKWFGLAMGAGIKEECGPLALWLGTVGRMKFVRPGYKNLTKVDRELAVKTFQKNSLFYHPICRAMVSKDLSLKAL